MQWALSTLVRSLLGVVRWPVVPGGRAAGPSSPPKLSGHPLVVVSVLVVTGRVQCPRVQWTAFMTRRGAVIALVLLAVCAAAAPAAWAARWVVQPAPRPPGATRAPLTAVSCPTRRFCAAVGSWSNGPYGGLDSAPLAETFNGRRWTLSLTPSMPTGWAGLFAVSCPCQPVSASPSASTAMAAGWSNGSTALGGGLCDCRPMPPAC